MEKQQLVFDPEVKRKIMLDIGKSMNLGVGVIYIELIILIADTYLKQL